jgi:FkbM family methyltransferase
MPKGVTAYLTAGTIREDPVRLLLRRLRYEVEGIVAPQRHQGLRRFTVDRGRIVMWASPSDTVGRNLYLHGAFEWATTLALRSLVAPGDVFIDAGAHIGTYSLLAARLAGPSGRVLAFEPDDRNRALLERNVVENRVSTVTVSEYALWSENAELVLAASPDADNSGMPSLMRDGDGPRVLCRTLDDTSAACDVLKVDVEGAEVELLRGARRLLGEQQPSIVIEVNDDGPLQLLRDAGYSIYGMVTDRRALRLFPIAEGEDPARYREAWHALNVVALHPEGVARRSLHLPIVR